ncbi:TetR/AcrR family transcriptional regulator [Actinospica sp.]|jgi:AcrR family transcriptional regulator|uniref:TetR/AcrR family transcriptional regulator n=1 Tax=Actinospica sp. TaxID=1872142 RepID=UPI002B70C2DF|nr:TetR/AcrR family transcriptional regulator [Actinospica sp.]HWG24312.1 TetR/AcrR family transcriptional regulator [Actinospica sp.]
MRDMTVASTDYTVRTARTPPTQGAAPSFPRLAPEPGLIGQPAPLPRDRAAANAPAPARPRERRTLTRADWIGTAVEALARDGLRAVAVEPLAERLGATKGSFYWHFRDRNALLQAAVEHWEATAVDEPIARLEEIADPIERHNAAVELTNSSPKDVKIFLVLLWNADHAVIGPAIERIMRKRMTYSQRLREQAGLAPDQAERSALHSYSVWLGLQLVRQAVPGMVAEELTGEGLSDYVAQLGRQAVGL